MKKIISILLVLVILISSVCSTSVFAAVENTGLDWTNTSKWILNDSNSQNIGNNTGAQPYTGGDGVTVDTTTFPDRGTTLKLDSGSYYASLPLDTEPNTDYRLTFSYYSTAVANSNSVSDTNYAYAFNSAGIFIPNHPEFKDVDSTYTRLGFGNAMTYLVNYASNYQMYTPAGRNWDGPTTKNNVDQNGDGNPEDGRKYDVLPNFHNIEANKWYTLSYNFNSSDFEDIAFTFQKVAGGEMWIDDIVLEKSVAGNDDYFEDTSKWIFSLMGDRDARRNIAATRESDTYSTYSDAGLPKPNTTDSANGDGRCIKTTWPSHAYNIPLSNLKNLEKNSTYSIEFYYKVINTTGGDTDAAFQAMGVYSPKFMGEQLNKAASNGNISSLNFYYYTVGWAAVDRVIDGKFCRYRDDTLTNCSVSANSYDSPKPGYTFGALKGQWIKEKIVFSVKDYNDLHLVIIPGKTNEILLDDFRLVKLDNAFENPDAWSAIKNDNTVDTSLQPTVKRLTKNGSIVKTLEMSGSAGVYATKVTTERNHYYSFSFDYYGTELGSVNNDRYCAIIESCGVAELNDDGKLIRRNAFTDDPARIYTTYLSVSFEGNTIGRRLPSQVCLREVVNGDETNNIVSGDGWYTISFEFSSGDNDALEFYIDPLTPTTFNVANFQLKDLNVIETQNKVGIRAQSGPKGQGIRVNNRISKAEITKKNIVSYGAIAIRKERMANVGFALTFDTQGIATGVAYNTNNPSNPYFDKFVPNPILRYPADADTTNYNNFSCVLINIPQKYYGDTYSVRSFAIDKAGNVYYGEVVEVSVFDVVYSILKSDTASQNDKNTANSIVNEIKTAAENNNEITTYKEWCTANGLTDNSTAAQQ